MVLLLMANVMAAAGAATRVVVTEKLLASDGSGIDHFGRDVAVSGDTAVVGAHADDDGGLNSGSAYIFVRDRDTWIQQAKLTASDAAAGDEFGRAVAVSGDIALVGAPFDKEDGRSFGAAYVFVRHGTAWTEEAKLAASDPDAGALFGFSVAIDRDTAVIGARGDDASASDSGSAYVFVRNGSSWTDQGKLTASDGGAGHEFGHSVAISGETTVVGARADDHAGLYSGSAYAFIRTGSSWVEQAKLTATPATRLDGFGVSVALSGDTALVGSFENGQGGSVYVFDRAGSNWAQQSRLTASGADPGTIGTTVALEGDIALVGSSNQTSTALYAGAVYVFSRSGGAWHGQAVLIATDAARSDQFGSSVAISGGTALIGAPNVDDLGPQSGAAYVMHLPGKLDPPPCSIVGTAGNDVLIGTADADVICGHGGNDIIYGLAGDDILRGGDGNDRLFGGFGFDSIAGNAGDDRLVGGAQGDTMLGGPGNDVLRGKGGDDRLEGNEGNDHLWGAKGDDDLFGGQGTDLCSGGLGDDTLTSCE